MSLTLIILSKNNQRRILFLIFDCVVFIFLPLQDLCTESLVVDVLKRQFSLSKDIRALHKLLVRERKDKKL